MKTRVLYFAYGSNMKTSRLLKRIPSAKPVGRGRIHGKRLECSKKSDDGSTRANLEDNPRSVVWGALYEIDGKDWEKLDEIEGGYERETARIQTADGGIVEARASLGILGNLGLAENALEMLSKISSQVLRTNWPWMFCPKLEIWNPWLINGEQPYCSLNVNNARAMV